MIVQTWLDRSTLDVKQDYTTPGSWGLIAQFIGRREWITKVATLPAVLMLFAKQGNLTPSGKTVTLPYGIVVPGKGDPKDYVMLIGTVNEEKTKLTVTAVNEAAGTVTFAETVDSGTKVDAYCLPAIPVLFELRIRNPETGARVERTLLSVDLSSLHQRELWNRESFMILNVPYPLPEDWVWEFWVKCSLPILWVADGFEVPHKIFIPLTMEPAAGLQEAIKANMARELMM